MIAQPPPLAPRVYIYIFRSRVVLEGCFHHHFIWKNRLGGTITKNVLPRCSSLFTIRPMSMSHLENRLGGTMTKNVLPRCSSLFTLRPMSMSHLENRLGGTMTKNVLPSPSSLFTLRSISMSHLENWLGGTMTKMRFQDVLHSSP